MNGKVLHATEGGRVVNAWCIKADVEAEIMHMILFHTKIVVGQSLATQFLIFAKAARAGTLFEPLLDIASSNMP